MDPYLMFMASTTRERVALYPLSSYNNFAKVTRPSLTKESAPAYDAYATSTSKKHTHKAPPKTRTLRERERDQTRDSNSG